MNADLEKTLDELGPEYRAVVARLRAGAEAEVRCDNRVARSVLMMPLPRVVSLLAASLLVALGLAVWFGSQPSAPRPQPSSYGAREYHMTVAEMIATQRDDGSWANDFLTRRNADALKGLGDRRAQIAYKKAMRNLRLRQAL